MKTRLFSGQKYVILTLAVIITAAITLPAAADLYMTARTPEEKEEKRAVLKYFGFVQGMQGRFVGPTHGTRGPAVAGHPTKKHVYFHGSASGGLWKTEDDGMYWEPVGDGQFGMGSIGAIAISPSDPNVMYVGTGEPNLRDSVSWGDGVYKSTDGGETWTNIGLKKTRHISRIRIHPENPDIVYVAAIGNPFGAGEDRGVYRSKDGGKTWEKVLYKSDVAGAIDLVMDVTNPTGLYASIYQIQRRTWGVQSGGPDSGIWKSTDGGDTWQDITRNPGLPDGTLGRIGLALSPAKPERISALIDSEKQSGMYQSDDGGKTWQFLSDHVGIIQRPFYYFHVYAHPVNPDELWVLSNKLWQSLDGGKTWTQRSGTKDDFHDMWISPNDPERMIVIHDGGAMVSTTAGKTWSKPYTQKTGQFYRVNVDNQFPYNLYGNGQDLIGYKVPSASVWGGISYNDVTVLGTGESGASVPHPEDPDLIYHLAQSSMAAGGGPIQRVNLKTEQYEHINVWPVITFGRGQNEAKYRFNWHAPIVIDPHDPETIYTAAEYVFRSTDRGQSWEKISPVLTRDDESKQQAGGAPWAPETSGQENYNTIHRMAASVHEQGVLWAGSDDGLLHVTRDNSNTWTNVTPPNLPEDSGIYEIELSPHDPATAYIAITRYRTANDLTPYLFKTDDYGETWTNISNTFDQEEITRTIREDTVRKGLLFVGTETGIFYSLDDGKSWQRFEMGLPRVPVHDMKIKGEDLVIATHGRGFWIVDDISPLRQHTEKIVSGNHLYKPRTVIRLGRNWWAAYGGGVFGGQKNYFVQNHRPGHTFIELGVINGMRRRYFLEGGQPRPDGAVIYYNLVEGAKDVSLTILDKEGNEIKTFTGDQIGTSTGLNQFVWDMNYPDAKSVPGKPAPGIIVMAKPDTYQVRLTVDGKTQTQPFELKINPNETWTKVDTDARFDLWMKIRSVTENANLAVIDALNVSESVQKEAATKKSPKARELAAKIEQAAQDFQGMLIPVGKTLSEIANEPSKLLSKLATVSHMLYSSEGRPTKSAYAVVEELSADIDASIAGWKKVVETDVAAFDTLQ